MFGLLNEIRDHLSRSGQGKRAACLACTKCRVSERGRGREGGRVIENATERERERVWETVLKKKCNGK